MAGAAADAAADAAAVTAAAAAGGSGNYGAGNNIYAGLRFGFSGGRPVHDISI